MPLRDRLIFVGLWFLFWRKTININTKLYYERAKKLFFSVIPKVEINCFELKINKWSYFFYQNDTPFNTHSSSALVTDKYCTNQILAMANIPVPKGILLERADFEGKRLEDLIASLRLPLVIKPSDGAQGVGVLCNIKTFDELKIILKKYSTLCSSLIVEEFYAQLQSYRILVFNGKIIGVVLYQSARVLGDGIHTIQELVDLTNITRKEFSDSLSPIVLDDECQLQLKELGLDPSYIPAKDELIVLCHTNTPERGGSYQTLGIKICKENRKTITRIAGILNLGLTAINIECTDINVPFSQSQWVILGANPCPSMLIHEYPMTGKPQPVTKKILQSLIFRHPFSYLRVLYSHKSSSIYIKAIIAVLASVVIYWFIWGIISPLEVMKRLINLKSIL